MTVADLLDSLQRHDPAATAVPWDHTTDKGGVAKLASPRCNQWSSARAGPRLALV